MGVSEKLYKIILGVEYPFKCYVCYNSAVFGTLKCTAEFTDKYLW